MKLSPRLQQAARLRSEAEITSVFVARPRSLPRVRRSDMTTSCNSSPSESGSSVKVVDWQCSEAVREVNKKIFFNILFIDFCEIYCEFTKNPGVKDFCPAFINDMIIIIWNNCKIFF